MAQSKDVRLVTEAKLEVSQATALAPIKNDVADLKTVAGLAPGDVNDATAANLIETPGTETHTALSAAIGEAVDPKADANQATILPSTNVVASCGDSITNASGATTGRGYAQIIRYVAGTRNVDQVYKIYATGGWTSTQILGTHIPAACVGEAAVVHVAWGTNDAGTGVTVATFAANTIEAHRQITAAGKRMSISLIPPRGSGATAAWRKDRAAYNEWISRWAPLANVPVADTSTLTDPSTGHLAASCDSGDGTHPNDTGHARIAKAVSAAVLQALPVQPHRPVRAPDVNLLPNGAIGVTPAAGFPAGWSEFAGGTGTAPTYSTKTDTTSTLKEGLWLEMDWNAAAGGTRAIKAGGLTMGTGWAALDQAEIGMVFQIEDVSGFTAAMEAGTASITVELLASDGVSVQGTMLPAIRTAPGRIAYRLGMPNTTYPSISITVTAPTGVHVKVRVGEATLYNLTALGVTRSSVGS